MNEPERTEAEGHEGQALEHGRGGQTLGRVKLGVYVGRLAGAFVGLWLGVTLGVWVGWSAAPVVGAVAGLFAGAHFSDFVFRAFPRLAPEQTITARAAARGLSGIVVGLLLGDIVGTFTSLDRAYTVLVGAALGLYVGVVSGNARGKK
jgi:hypothetical protein